MVDGGGEATDVEAAAVLDVHEVVDVDEAVDDDTMRWSM